MLANALPQCRRFDGSRRPLFGARLTTCVVVAALSVLSATAAAQENAFRDALIGLHANLSGDYGDEGPLIVDNLQRTASSLAVWDEMVRSAEQNLRSQLPASSPGERLRIHTTLAETFAKRGRHVDSLREIDAAIQVDARRGSLHVFRGMVLETIGRPEEALRAFTRAWELDRDDPVSAYLVASRGTGQSDPDVMTPQAMQLLKAFDRRLASVPSDRHIPLFAELALVRDDAAVTPVFSPALYADGLTLVAKGQYDEAIASLRNATSRDPLVIATPPQLQTAIAKLRDGDVDQAIGMLEAAAPSAPQSSELHRILAAAYSDAGRDGKSIEQLEIAIRLAPNDERANVALGRALAHDHQVDRAERALLNTIGRLPQSADAHSALADLYESVDRGRDALRELEVTASFTVLAGKGALYWRLADLHHRYLEYERVIEPLARRARLNPNDARAHTDLGLAYTRVGRSNDALVELVMASLIGPDDPDALTAIGQIQFDSGNYAAAEVILRRAIAIKPALAQARYLLGHSLARLSRASESQEQLEEFERLRTAANEEQRRTFEIDVLRQGAAKATDAGRHDEAADAWKQVVQREPQRAEHRLNLAAALIRAGRGAEAVEHLETATRLGADIDVYRQLSELYARLGRVAESAAARDKYQSLLRERRRTAK